MIARLGFSLGGQRLMLILGGALVLTSVEDAAQLLVVPGRADAHDARFGILFFDDDAFVSILAGNSRS